ncbi:MAG: ABC transporter ATP-binding protein [Propionibacteriaceae bacterium]
MSVTGSAPAIRVQGLGKSYRIGATGYRPNSVVEALTNKLRTPKDPTRRSYTTFDALDDVSFEIGAGEAVGIVGRNGAGKSTLLKVLTQITAPTRGRIELAGRMGSLLEVGTGFHGELTGRENIFLNGSLLGMTKKQIHRRYDEIVDFSGVEKFLETPVKRYSSGMYVRLAFAVAAHLDTAILAIDEVLAVGDAEFQRKSLAKMRDAAADGRTVLYVSHQVQTVKALCTSAIFLDRGRLRYQGDVEGALQVYRESFESFATEQREASQRPGTGTLRLTEVKVENQYQKSTDDLVVDFGVGANPDLAGGYFVSCHVNDDSGMVIAQCDSRLRGTWFDAATPQDSRIRVRNLWLKPGRYTIDLYLCQAGVLDAWEGAGQFEVLPDLPYAEAAQAEATSQGVVFADFIYEEL